MAQFGLAFPLILRHEGTKFTDDPMDRGGATRYGVSLRALATYGAEGDFNHDGHVDSRDISSMTEDQARTFYRAHYWRYDGIDDQRVANKVFDMAVNFGPVPAHRMLQRALVAMDRPVMIDGAYGPKTQQAVNEVDPVGLLEDLRMLAVKRYQDIVEADASQSRFLDGWLRRAVA
jgi:lysozyme family protein